MPEFTFSVIHLGNIADLDPTDGNTVAENQSALLGSYYSAGDPASDHIVTLTAQDTNSDNLINTNDTASPEAISFDLGDGPVATQYDSLFNLDVTVTFDSASGEPPYNGLGGVIQTETGDLFFVMIDDDAGLGANSFDDVAIDSITINSISAYGSQQSATVSDGQSFVPCFAAGTQIETPDGLIPVENIAVGDRVITLDCGVQRVKWVGRRFLSARQLAEHPKLRAIHISAGALGDGYPSRDLLVSPQHRILLKSKITKRMTGQSEILVAAKKLAGFPGIRQVDCGLGVQYHHFACESHQLVWANGAVAETLLLGSQLGKWLSPKAREELAMILPCAFGIEAPLGIEPARPIVQRRAVLQNMLARHIKNDMKLVTL
ncbi:Hint domain-containing protein [uncultured Litoreibacter sp.]|uniref:Hint domain-containing protein n=1 Tax=uncultured Litoreibacter sp. TaxID=1392394 RepID=UPI002601EAD8|nr:Hint domain-containing protein [uncultured Litoreibacter sp.]